MSASGAGSTPFARDGGRLHIGVGAPWREALAATETDARVWEYPKMTRGDLLLTMLNTRPAVLLCLERVEAFRDRSRYATIAATLWQGPPLLALHEVERRAGVRIRRGVATLHDDVADAILFGLSEEAAHPAPIWAKEGRCWPSRSRGLSSGLQAVALARSRGRCAGCEQNFAAILDGAGWGALEVHTLRHLKGGPAPVDSGVADVAVVCCSCHNMLHGPPYPSVLELIYAWRPGCPHCGVNKTDRISYGEPVAPPGDGEVAGGCVIPPGGIDAWSCAACGWRWSDLGTSPR